MKERFDLLILGGGIFGATAVWHAARRGLRTLLLERDDFGSGASSSSMKILHGGMRYLQSMNLRRSFESMHERRRMMRLAPRFMRALPFRLETPGRGSFYRAAFRAGLRFTDLLAGPDSPVPHSHYPAWHEVQVTDTERVLIGFLHGALRYGGENILIRNHTRMEDLHRFPAGGFEATVEGMGRIKTAAVLRCTGPDPSMEPVVVSMNLLFDELPLNRDGTAVALRHPRDGRNLFCVPWRRRSIVGTYDRACTFNPARPFRPNDGWVEEALEWFRPAHDQLRGLRLEDVRFVHAGVLPGQRRPPAVPATRDAVSLLPDGTWSVRGVKWTTACGVTERIVARLAGRLPGNSSKGVAREEVLPDPLHENEDWFHADPARLLPVAGAEHNLRRGDILLAVQKEWAKTLSDVLLRRTGVAATGHPGGEIVTAAADVMQRELRWSDEERKAQVAAFDHDFRFG